jgi:hypothetical protein
LRWLPINNNCIESVDGKWSIAKFNAGDSWRYQLTRLGKRKGMGQRVSYEGSESVLIAASAEECKRHAGGLRE